ncbi:hypothetical protein SAOR_11465 [Salinisphaera orenii MK-B5]|uniref:Uncharacterized protein n=1 Tax=Salinisphaera orenii MK-B5 TaxID=856730 RepID=A0A423PL49_9GAMM|nr:hypothetical protein SAOR_11465 [Salinisphaera orenii MK-B5]
MPEPSGAFVTVGSGTLAAGRARSSDIEIIDPCDDVIR